MGVLRSVAVLLCTLVVGSGCSAPTETASPATTGAVDGPHLSRLGEVASDFPTGFLPPSFTGAKLTSVYLDQVGVVVSYGKPFTVDPPQCRALLKPVDGVLGAETNGSRADGPDAQSIAVNADAPVVVSAKIPASGCDRMTFDVDDDAVRTRGTAERVAAPSVDGATTYALRLRIDGAPDTQYHYAAIMDDRLYVSVDARLSPGVDAQSMLSELLVKAVAAVAAR